MENYKIYFRGPERSKNTISTDGHFGRIVNSQENSSKPQEIFCVVNF